MSKKKKEPIIIDAMTIWNIEKPRYNGWGVGHGPHKNKKKYCRKPKHRKSYGEEGIN